MRPHHDNSPACQIRFDGFATSQVRSQRAGTRVKRRRRVIGFQPRLQELESRQLLSGDILSVTGVPTTTTAGTAEKFTVTAVGSTGRTDTSYTGTVHFTSTDGHAVLPANYNFTTANHGTDTFTVTLETAGTQSLTATDTSNSTTTGSETGIAVQAAAASSLTISGFPAAVNAGSPTNLTVTAYDSYGNVATGYAGTVQFTSSDSHATLPPGYTFTSTDAGAHTFSVTLSTPGTQSTTVTAANLKSVSLTATVNDMPPTVSLGSPASGQAGDLEYFSASATDISPADQAAGFTYAWNFGDGVTTTGASPSHAFAAAGTYTVTVTATDEYGKSGSANGKVVISSSGSTPYGGTPWPVPGIIQAENFDNGGEGVAYKDTTPGNAGGAYRSTDVDIQATSDAGGGYNVGWIAATEWLNYTINVATAGTYQLSLRVASPSQGGKLNVDFGGVNKTGTLTIPNTNGWQTWQTITTSVQLNAGQQIMQVDFDSNGATGLVGNFNWLQLTAPSSSLLVSAGSSFTANAGASDTFAGSVSGGTAPYSYGWTFGDGSTSSGSPTPSHVYANPGTYTATLTATDSVGAVGTSSVAVTVNDVAPTVTLTDPPGTVGCAVSFSASATDISPAVQAAGFTYSWNFGDGSTGTGATTSHIYTSAGTFTATVTAMDEYGKSGTASGTIVIVSASHRERGVSDQRQRRVARHLQPGDRERGRRPLDL